jgi:hypothetical protein
MVTKRSIGLGWKFLLLCGVLIVIAAALESVSSAVLFRYYAHKDSGLYPHGTATAFLLRKALHLEPFAIFTADRSDMFQPDQVLGYRFNPGVYHIVETSESAGLHAFKVTIQNDGYRATSVSRTADTPRIYVLGNSGIWGFGIDDEMSVPWMLQAHLPKFYVLNLAVTGYTMVQSLLQFRALQNQFRPDDIVVFSYWSAGQHYSVGDTSQSFGHDFELELTKDPVFPKLRLPFGYLSGKGDLSIRYLPISCATRVSDCSPAPGEIVDAQRVTEAIFDEILQKPRCHIVVALIEGPNDDPIIAHLRSSGVTVADLRFPKSKIDANDYTPAHDHLGAFASHARFEDLLHALSASGLSTPE